MEPLLIEGRWQPSRDAAGGFRAEDPARGEALGPEFPVSGARDLEAALAAAAATAPTLAATAPERIAAFLDAYAAAIEGDAAALAARAHAETGLPIEPRLAKVELPRTVDQLRQAAHAARERSWTAPVIDTRARLRACFAPLGKPVAVFGPNNFPLAFNAVAGSDFACAIVARNPVIAKAHPSHPQTSQRLAELAHAALAQAGLPAATVQLLYHLPAELGTRLVGDRRLGAVGFTGSRGAGLALKAAADAAGVPFYAELSSLNPVFLLPGALAERGAEIAAELAASCTLGCGQFCTKPGLAVFVDDDAGRAFAAAVRERIAAAPAGVLLNRPVRTHFEDALRTLQRAGAATLVAGGRDDGTGYRVRPALLQVDARTFLDRAEALQTEAFGPATLLVEVPDVDAMAAVAAALDGNLTGALYSARDGRDDAAWQRIAEVLRPRVGRLLDDRMPTGVAVSAAMNHGGPYPATSHPGFTAVGLPAAVRRFAALHSYDGVREQRLPPELRDRNPTGRLPRTIDGVCTLADVGP